MKKGTIPIYIALVLSVVLIAPLILASSVYAALPPGAPAPGSTFAQRLEQRKQEQQVKMDKKEMDRLSGRCINVQSLIRPLQQATGQTVSKRTSTYQKIDAKLWVVIGQLKLAGKDTFKLEKQRTELAGKAAAFQTVSAQYQQTMDDILIINCQADIVGFKSLLETVRAYHNQVRTGSADVRSFVLDTIKPSLADYVTQLQPQAETGGQ